MEYNHDLPDAILCDIDGTLAFHEERSPFEYEKLHTDTLIQPVYNVLQSLSTDCEVIIMSGRPNENREATEKWLKDNNVHYDALFMRKTDDDRNDSIIKQELFDENIRGKWNIRTVLDDRDRVVHMWRSLGLTCLQVNDGDF